jgi:hypothetical protein
MRKNKNEQTIKSGPQKESERVLKYFWHCLQRDRSQLIIAFLVLAAIVVCAVITHPASTLVGGS